MIKSKPLVFVSFDIEHDEELYRLLVEQSRIPLSGFSVSAGSERLKTTEIWSERTRRRIGEANQMIVICGEHTGESAGVRAELAIAQQERTPYFLLWGRRDSMCTKPIGAKSADGMYSWTRQILQERLALSIDKAAADATAKALREARKR